MRFEVTCEDLFGALCLRTRTINCIVLRKASARFALPCYAYTLNLVDVEASYEPECLRSRRIFLGSYPTSLRYGCGRPLVSLRSGGFAVSAGGVCAVVSCGRGECGRGGE